MKPLLLLGLSLLSLVSSQKIDPCLDDCAKSYEGTAEDSCRRGCEFVKLLAKFNMPNKLQECHNSCSSAYHESKELEACKKPCATPPVDMEPTWFENPVGAVEPMVSNIMGMVRQLFGVKDTETAVQPKSETTEPEPTEEDPSSALRRFFSDSLNGARGSPGQETDGSGDHRVIFTRIRVFVPFGDSNEDKGDSLGAASAAENALTSSDDFAMHSSDMHAPRSGYLAHKFNCILRSLRTEPILLPLLILLVMTILLFIMQMTIYCIRRRRIVIRSSGSNRGPSHMKLPAYTELSNAQAGPLPEKVPIV